MSCGYLRDSSWAALVIAGCNSGSLSCSADIYCSYNIIITQSRAYRSQSIRSVFFSERGFFMRLFEVRDILAFSEQTARKAAGSPKDWMAYLDTAARLYRYPFADSLLIHAQRPDATACASLELWNQKMNRWVNRGAKGIALIDDTGPRKRLRYVFDISDTHMARGGRTPHLWRMEKRHKEKFAAYLAETYAITRREGTGLEAVLYDLAEKLAEEKLDETVSGLMGEAEALS